MRHLTLVFLPVILFLFAATWAKPPRRAHPSDTSWLAGDTVPHVNVLVRGKEYKGVIFDTVGNFHYKFKHGRWLPLPADIALAESLITADADSLFKKEPGIKATLGQYLRQYVGYLDEKGNRCLYLNCFCAAKLERFPDWDYAQVSETEGGECFWEVNVNLIRRQVFGLSVSLR